MVEADLLLHVVDASTPEVEEREAAVLSVLKEIGADERPQLLVLNKADLAPEGRGDALVQARDGAVARVGADREGLPGLLDTVAARLDLAAQRVRLRFRASERRAIAGRLRDRPRARRTWRTASSSSSTPSCPARALERYRGHLR